MSALPHVVQLALWIGGAIVLLGAAPCFLTARDRLRRVRTGDLHVFALAAALTGTLVRDVTGVRGTPRRWGVVLSGQVVVFHDRGCEWLEQCLTAQWLAPTDTPEPAEGWGRMQATRLGRRFLRSHGMGPAAGAGADQLASRRVVRAVAATEVVDRAA